MIANLKAAKKLVDKKLYMIVCQLLGFDDITEIGTHQVRYKIPEKHHQAPSLNSKNFTKIK